MSHEKAASNGPVGLIIQYGAGKVIGTSTSGSPTSTIKIKIRGCVIQTAFPHKVEMIMGSDGTLIERFVVQELNDNVRSILKEAFDDRMCSKNVLLRDFEFNNFDVSLGFEKGIVTLQDVLSSGENSFLDIPIRDFISACGLNVSCSL